MKKQILSLVFGIFLLTTISALYGGESVIIDLDQDYEYYSIVGNSSEVIFFFIISQTTPIIIMSHKYRKATGLYISQSK